MENKCIFCEIVKGNIACKKIAENENAIAFLDVRPITNGHTLVIPKKHYIDLGTCNSDVLKDVILLVQNVSRKLETCKKLDPWGFNYLSNQGKIAGQEVFHFHVHIIPKYDTKNGFSFNVNKDDQLESIDDVFSWISKK